MAKVGKSRIKTTVIMMLMIIMAATFFFPLIYMIFNSLKDKKAYYQNPFLYPKSLYLSNYISMFRDFSVLTNIMNTLVITVGSTLLILLFSIFASYAFAKLHFKMKNTLFLLIMCTLFLPGQVTMVPMYVLFSKMGMIDSYWSVILIYLASGLPGSILLMRSNFIGIPNDVIQSAKIDGANYFTVVFRMVVPLGVAAIAISVIFNFIGYWNDLLTPLLFLQSSSKQTLMVALSALAQKASGDIPFEMSGLVISVVPTLIIYLIFQKYLVQGLTVGSFR